MEMVGLLACLGSLLGYSLAANRLVGMHPSHTPLFAGCSVILALYVAGLAGWLNAGSWLVLAGGYIALAGSLAQTVFSIRGSKHQVPEPPTEVAPDSVASFLGRHALAILAAIVLASLAIRWAPGFQFLAWDEFSHWAYAGRMMTAVDAFPDASSPMMFKDYPPGATLFQYFFLNIAGYYEWIGLFAQTALIWSAILAIVGRASEHWIVGPLTFALAVVLTAAMDYSFTDIYVDALLAVLLAAALTVIATERLDWTSTAYLAVTLSCLVLVKQIGVALAMVGVGAFFLAALVNCIRQSRGDASSDPRQLMLVFARTAVVVGSVAAAYLGWQAYIAAVDVSVTLQPNGSPEEVAAFFLNPANPRSEHTWNELARRMGSGGLFSLEYPLPGVYDVTLRPSIIALTAVMLGLSVVAIMLCRRDKRAISSIVLGITALGLLPYLGVLMIVYRFVYSEYEGMLLVSFERYLGSYLLAWLLVIVSILAATAVSHRKVFATLFALGAIVAIMGAPASLVRALVLPESLRNVPIVYPWANTYEELTELRGNVQALADAVNHAAKSPDERVFYVSQNETGYTLFMFRFLIAPRHASLYGFSLGEPYREGDIWTRNQSLDSLLEGYDLLAIRHADEQFWRHAGRLFPADQPHVESGVFRVQRDDAGLKIIPSSSE